jgi:hypothetical protein
VIAGTATAVSNRVSRRQAGRWADQDQQQAYEQQQAYQQQAYQQPPPPQPVYQEPTPPPQPVVVVAAPPPTPAAAPVADTSMETKLAQLQQLGELKAQGILSEAEFEAQKQKILAS